MRYSRIIIILLVTAMAWGMAGQATAWTRHGHHRYDFYDRYNPYNRPFYPWRHRLPGYIHDYRPRYTEIYTEQGGWDLVKNYRSDTALEIFEDISNATPVAGGPRLGIAVAAADTGQLSKSVTAMRLALRYNPGALQIFKPEDWLKDRLKSLVKKYQGQSHGLPDQDAYFMQAAFYYIVKDRDACLEAVRLGKKADDTSESALNLFYMAEKDVWRFN